MGQSFALILVDHAASIEPLRRSSPSVFSKPTAHVNTIGSWRNPRHPADHRIWSCTGASCSTAKVFGRSASTSIRSGVPGTGSSLGLDVYGVNYCGRHDRTIVAVHGREDRSGMRATDDAKERH